MVLLRQSVASILKVFTRSSHLLMRVMFGLWKLAVLQEGLTSISHLKRVSVRLASCLAPSLSFSPPQLRSDLLPPPISTSLLAMGAKSPFLPALLSPVLFCFLILLYWASKFLTISFHIFIILMDMDRQSVLTVLLLCLLLFLFDFVFLAAFFGDFRDFLRDLGFLLLVGFLLLFLFGLLF